MAQRINPSIRATVTRNCFLKATFSGTTNYQWGDTRSAPFTSGSFDAQSFFIFGGIGTQKSVVWAQDARGVGAANLLPPPVVVRHAPAKFDALFPLGGIQYSVTSPISSPFLPDAPYYEFTGSINNPGPSPLRNSLLGQATAVGVLPGEILDTGSTIEIIDQAVNDIVETLFNFESSVALNAEGHYIYTYRITNHSTNTVDVSWSALGLDAVHLDSASGNDSHTLILESALGRGATVISTHSARGYYEGLSTPPARPGFLNQSKSGRLLEVTVSER